MPAAPCSSRRPKVGLVLVASLAGAWALGCQPAHKSPVAGDSDGLAPAGQDAGPAPARIRRVLRALVFDPQDTELPRDGSRLQADRARATALAERLGRELVLVPVARLDDLVPALLAGQGELIASELPSARALPGLAFSRTTRHVDRQVVVPAKTSRPPRRLSDLRRLKLLVTDQAAAELRAGLPAWLLPKLKLEQVDDSTDLEVIFDRVGASRDLATVALSHRLDEFLAWRDDVKPALGIDRVALALAVREQDGELLAAIDSFLFEYALTTHRRLRHGGDLREIKKRSVIRVAMLNNSVAYFIYRGQEVGYQYDLAVLLAMRLGVRLEVVVPEQPGDLLRVLVEGRADLALVTPIQTNPLLELCALSEPIDHADQVLVQPAGQPPVTRAAELAGRTIHVRRTSQYFETLQPFALTVPGLKIVAAPEEIGTQGLIAQVGRGQIPLTVANSALLGVERSYRDDVQGSFVFAKAKPLVFAVPRESVKLLARLKRFVLEECRGPQHEALYAKYFAQNRRMAEVRAQALAVSGAISPYDELVRAVAAEHGLDWRLVLSQMYQESRFDPHARSWAGAQGLLQVMPETGRQLGLKDPWDPEQNIRVGVGYLAELIERFEPSLRPRQRVRFALAAYNAGLGHVRDARRLARHKGYDPDRWFGHVERAIVLLERPEYHRQARHGYCRGSEPAQYVGQIQTKYDAYSRLAPLAGSSAAAPPSSDSKTH